MGSAEPQVVTMRAFIIVALVASVYGEAKPYTVGQVLTGATNGGLITSTTYHGGLKVAGFPHAAVVPALGYAAPVVYGKREAEAEPYTVGQVLAGHTAGGVITSSTTTSAPSPRPTRCTPWRPPPSDSPTPPTSASAPTLSELPFPARQQICMFQKLNLD